MRENFFTTLQASESTVSQQPWKKESPKLSGAGALSELRTKTTF